MRVILSVAPALVALAVPTAAAADTVCDWMEYAGRVIDADAPPPGVTAPPSFARSETQVALAMFEALNAIDRRYVSYLELPLADAQASQDVAAITAAYRVLRSNHPGQRTQLDENYLMAMFGFADSPAKEAGRALGEAAATAALAAGGIDPAIAPVPYRPRAEPGVWGATALPVYDPVSFTYRMWVLPRIDAVRPPPPPELTSARYARDFDEVRRLGGREGSERTPVQTLMARYRITPDMAPSLRFAADMPGRTPVQNARMFAILFMASDDSGMANHEAKLFYDFWRPITAIRNADRDGNDATTREAGWLPLINTPNHPEYPCGHCTYAATMATVMEAELGPRPPSGVRVSSRSLTGAAVHPLATWDEWVTAVSFSRTLGGVHYRFSNEAGEAIGREVGRRALAQLMQPLPEGERRVAR